MAFDSREPAAPPERPSDAVLAQCYGEMRTMARRILAGNSLRWVLQPTELANEAAVKLIRSSLATQDDQGRVLAVAAQTMRRILIDEARRSAAAKRSPVTVMTVWPGGGATMDMADLDEALAALATLSPERARVVELRFTLGMTVEETAVATGVPERTIKRRWQSARAWLLDYLDDSVRPCVR